MGSLFGHRPAYYLAVVFFFHVIVESETLLCPPLSIPCNETSSCIPSKYLCDGDDDCGDGEDEQNCDRRGSGCGDASVQAGVNGTITSMGYPTSYSNLADCQWRVSVPDGYVVSMEFLDIFDIEKPRHGQCVYDSVSIYQDDPLVFIGIFCGSVHPDSITVNSSKAVIEFQSDSRTNGKGFKLRWEAQPVMMKELATSSPISPSKGHRTTVRDRRTTTLHEMSITSQPQCTSLMTADEDQGFISSPNFEVHQPYPVPIMCRWKINVQVGYSVALDFDYLDVGRYYSSQCNDGWLKVYDGPDDYSPLIGQYCDAIIPGEKISTSNMMYIEMFASKNEQRQMGFRATYVSFKKEVISTTSGPSPPGCDGTPILLTSPNGYITSSNFDHVTPYRNSLDCEWILQGSEGNVFFLEFQEFGLEQSGACDYDYLRIFDTISISIGHLNTSSTSNTDTQTRLKDISDESDWNKTSSSVLKEISNLCGQLLPYDIETGSSRVVVKFHSDDQVGDIGFNLSYSFQPPTVKCFDNEFECSVSGCVNKTLVCDGHEDCADGSDEIICPLSATCGHPKTQPKVLRIVGGREATKWAWPWTVSIVAPDGFHICGATLILPQWALTAAHCFDYIYSRKYNGYRIIAGRHRLGQTNANEQIRDIDDVIIPRDYVSATSMNDLALVRLKGNFNMTDQVNLACLPQDKVPEETPCYITGWGETLSSCCAGVLKQALVPIFNTSVCKGSDYYGDRLLSHMMCAGYPQGGVDSCGGDSGGPLACERMSTKTKTWEIQGVTSWGVACASPKSPGVYTIVHDYIHWIQQTIALNWS